MTTNNGIRGWRLDISRGLSDRRPRSVRHLADADRDVQEGVAPQFFPARDEVIAQLDVKLCRDVDPMPAAHAVQDEYRPVAAVDGLGDEVGHVGELGRLVEAP